MKRKTLLALLLGLAILAGVAIGLVVAGSLKLERFLGGGDAESVASTSLQSLREQQRLTAFSGRFVSVVTSSQSRLGFSSRKTMILPGTVRYEVDLALLRQKDLAWNAETKTLSVTLPPILVSRPQINPEDIREYGGGGLAAALTGGDARLDQANRVRGEQTLIAEARQPMPMRLAREAARHMVERSFAMPLKAAGIDAKVEARFVDEGRSDEEMDRSRSLEEVLKNGTGR